MPDARVQRMRVDFAAGGLSGVAASWGDRCRCRQVREDAVRVPLAAVVTPGTVSRRIQGLTGSTGLGLL